MLVTISGLPGAGTSTVARAVATHLGLDHLDGGTAFRALAAERGLTLAEFGTLAEVDASIDLALDDRLTARAREGEVVLESRLAGWIATNARLDAVRVWIECDDRERARRVARREGADLEATVAANREREASEAARDRTYYGIELDDHSVYDLVIDSTTRPPAEIVDRILAAIPRGGTPAG